MEITGKSRILFVLAHPIGHVRASHVFNSHFAATGKDAAAVPLHVHPDDLQQVVDAIRKMKNVSGFGVTIPHKIEIIRYLDETTETAKQIGAVNFVRREESGHLVGDNIDGAGFIDGLRRNDIEPKGMSVLMIGAGGAGRAVGFALAQSGVRSIWITNRDRDKAAALANVIHMAYPECKTNHGIDHGLHFDLIVNTTSLGMSGEDAPPISLDSLSPDTIVSDIIVNPPKTQLLEIAETKGCKIVNGVPMLDAQMILASKHMRI
ncbi:shikimate dehydrogenase [Ochrobactrum sp. CM-21-5]|nr:shikimate dehydrogenase [Ochrobactrum sp. CM-21-5]MBC2887097.1 shikimate dehydrogenase [Ochrobactrum sp. CM-21-5]